MDTHHSLAFFSLSSLGDFGSGATVALGTWPGQGQFPVIVGECCSVIYRQVATFLTAGWRFVPLKTLHREGDC